MLHEEAVLLARHLAVAALAFSLVPAVALADATGDLAQKPGPTGCFSSAGADECTAARGLLVAEAVATSPDGRNVYAAGSGSNAVAVFDRGADGALTQKEGAAGCVSLLGLGPCAAGTAIAGANSVTVSPDGRNVYAAGFLSGAVAVFDRADDGTLTQKPGSAGCVSALPPCSAGKAIVGPEAVVVSPDGRSLYVASTFSGAVAVFDRSADGTLTQKPGQAGCISDTGLGPCADGSALDGAASVSVSPDGRSVYAAAINSGAVTVFDRAADGTLTQKPGQAGCTSEAGTAPCSGGPGLGGAAWVTVSPDGRNAYVASFESAAVAVFDRGGSGELTQKPGTAGCLGKNAACSPGRALDGALAVTVSPDGRSVYATGSVNDAVAAFDRGADGTLAQKSGPAGCISETGAGG
ncbi:MAG: beta-propeller fold lactonase family protein [Solirubrobacterales bacterium]|nr:beta-propeller fold lactonase family protein [Solirubrobacterales bacterium]